MTSGRRFRARNERGKKRKGKVDIIVTLVIKWISW